MLSGIQDFNYILACARLDELKKYLDTTEKYLDEAKKDFVAWADDEVKKLSKEQRQQFDEFYSDDYWQYEERFPRILRNSFFVFAHSLLEHEMDTICDRLKKEKQIPINCNDLRGDTLNQFSLYCKLADLSFPQDDKVWQQIKSYWKIRNCIVHENALVNYSPDNKGFVDYLNDKGIISKDTINPELALTKQFCAEVIDTIQMFLDKLYKALGEAGVETGFEF